MQKTLSLFPFFPFPFFFFLILLLISVFFHVVGDIDTSDAFKELFRVEVIHKVGTLSRGREE